MKKSNLTTGINTLRAISPEKMAMITDCGRLVRNLAERRLQLVVTNRDTFDTGGRWHCRKKEGGDKHG